MKLTIYLISVVLLVIFSQNAETKDIRVRRQNKTNDQQLCENPVLLISERDLRGIRDIWAKIKESAITSWNYIKFVSERTKEQIKLFINNVKYHAIEIKDNFEIKLLELKDKLYTAISDLYGTGELVKLCLQKEQDNLEKILIDIMKNMSECIAEKIKYLTQFSSDEPYLAMNETRFINELDEKMDLCENDMANVQICLYKIREDIFDNFTDMENVILRHHYESRNIADDIKGTLVTCSLNNLMDATNLISAETFEIAKCVMEAKQEEPTLLE